MRTTLRLLTATAVAATGAIHLERYLNGFDALTVVGPLFLANVAISAVLAAVLVFRRDSVIGPAATAAFSAANILALVAAKTVGFFGVSAQAPLSDMEVLSFAVEGVALALSLVLIAMVSAEDEPVGAGTTARASA